MRTTVTLDPDVEVLLRNAVRETGAPFKQVLNNAVRQGLRSLQAAPAKPFKQRTFDLGVPRVNLTQANVLAAELEDEALIAKLRSGR